jgi:hypothetical protein
MTYMARAKLTNPSADDIGPALAGGATLRAAPPLGVSNERAVGMDELLGGLSPAAPRWRYADLTVRSASFGKKGPAT